MKLRSIYLTEEFYAAPIVNNAATYDDDMSSSGPTHQVIEAENNTTLAYIYQSKQERAIISVAQEAFDYDFPDLVKILYVAINTIVEQHVDYQFSYDASAEQYVKFDPWDKEGYEDLAKAVSMFIEHGWLAKDDPYGGDLDDNEFLLTKDGGKISPNSNLRGLIRYRGLLPRDELDNWRRILTSRHITLKSLSDAHGYWSANFITKDNSKMRWPEFEQATINFWNNNRRELTRSVFESNSFGSFKGLIEDYYYRLDGELNDTSFYGLVEEVKHALLDATAERNKLDLLNRDNDEV